MKWNNGTVELFCKPNSFATRHMQQYKRSTASGSLLVFFQLTYACGPARMKTGLLDSNGRHARRQIISRGPWIWRRRRCIEKGGAVPTSLLAINSRLIVLRAICTPPTKAGLHGATCPGFR